MEEFDYKAFPANALEQVKSGKALLGTGGAFSPLLENLLNAALEGEMDAYTSEERISGNRRNGYTNKQVQSSLGEVTVHTPATGNRVLIRSLSGNGNGFWRKASPTAS
jgi:hypothetical protein